MPSLRFPSALDLKNAIIHYGESKVPLKSIVVFLFFTLLLVYFAFLNPNEVDIHLTQVYSLRLPMIALFFGCVLLGILIAGFLNWTLSIKTSFENAKEIRRRRHQGKISQRADKFFEKAESLMAGGSVSKAIPIYKKILKLSPGHLGALNRLGSILREEGNPQRALELHARAAEIVPDNLEVLYSLADDYAAMAMNAEEMETLEKILKLDQNSPRPLYRLRATHLKTGDWALVLNVQKKLISRIEDTEEKEKEKKLLQGVIDDVYDQFVNAVSVGRSIAVQKVKELSDGRIFTGRQAFEIGLVDKLGSLEEAIKLAAELVGIEGKPKIVSEKKESNLLFKLLENKVLSYLPKQLHIIPGLQYLWQY